MTHGLQRATFNRSALARVLSDIHPEAPDPNYDFGERLGQWLDFSDALTLFSVLNAETSTGSVPPSTGSDLPARLATLRRQLSEAIQNDGVFARAPEEGRPPPRLPFPTPNAGASIESAVDFSPYHRYYVAHQRDMGAAITPLRADARKALASQSLAGRQLANLDAAFEKSLLAREYALLAGIPTLLAKCFDRRYAEHRAAITPADAGDGADDPVTWSRPGSWLDAFCHDTKTLLLAELELRLKPLTGLVAALTTTPGRIDGNNEAKPQ